jgi:hypothetical protein
LDFAGVSLPKNVVYGITYNTTEYGYSPIGQGASCFSTPQGCSYDSLNIALTQDPKDVTTGSDPGPTSTVFVHANLPYGYFNGGLAGLGLFREDSPTSGCWSLGLAGTRRTTSQRYNCASGVATSTNRSRRISPATVRSNSPTLYRA